MKPVRQSILKLRKLKEIRRKNLEKNFLEIQMKGQDPVSYTHLTLPTTR